MKKLVVPNKKTGKSEIKDFTEEDIRGREEAEQIKLQNAPLKEERKRREYRDLFSDPIYIEELKRALGLE